MPVRSKPPTNIKTKQNEMNLSHQGGGEILAISKKVTASF